MRSTSLMLAAALALACLGSGPGMAQGVTGGSGASTASPSTTDATPRAPRRSSRATRKAKEPTAGQMAARERQRKCGAEWQEAKAANKTGGLKWPQYWSRCNARLKGNSA